MSSERERDLVLADFGFSLGKKSERLQIRQQGRVIEEAPLFQVRRVVVQSRGVAVSSDALEACAVQGIPVHFLDSKGAPFATMLSPHLVGTIKTRREQLAAYGDERGLTLARTFAGTKMRNQAALLKYVGKYRKERYPALFRELMAAARELTALAAQVDNVSGTSVDEVRLTILNLEGRGAHAYWQAFFAGLPDDVAPSRREGRGADDLVNAVLNYGYGVLYAQVTSAVSFAGLDPYAGFLHVDRPGKPSLVLDLVEEFRQTCVDRVVFAQLNLGAAWKLDGDGRLDPASRRAVAGRVFERLDATEPYDGQRHRVGTILQRQARAIASFLRGERAYRGYVARW